MSLKLYFHPLASACWKVLIALYESETAFEARITDLGNEADRAELAALWPLAKFPVLVDETRGQVVPETSVIIEYLAQHYERAATLLPTEPSAARLTRLRDRFYDFYVHEPMQKIVGDRNRPAGTHDTYGVSEAKKLLETAYGMVERDLAASTWAAGSSFTLADCSAAPALYYANKVAPISAQYPNTQAFLRRLSERPAFARVLREAEPYFKLFPEVNRAP